jgi:hypothetical protein
VVEDTLPGLSGLALAVGGVLVAWLQFRPAKNDLRTLIQRDLDLLGQATDKELQSKLLAHVHRMVDRLIQEEDDKTREPVGIALGISLIVMSLWFGWLAHSATGWWQWAWLGVALTVGVFGLVGFVQDVTPRTRDARGRPVK